jgi:hypothetical protein
LPDGTSSIKEGPSVSPINSRSPWVQVVGNGTVACWEDNSFGQSTPPAGTFAEVAVGNAHTCGVTTDGPPLFRPGQRRSVSHLRVEDPRQRRLLGVQLQWPEHAPGRNLLGIHWQRSSPRRPLRPGQRGSKSWLRGDPQWLRRLLGCEHLWRGQSPLVSLHSGQRGGHVLLRGEEDRRDPRLLGTRQVRSEQAHCG